MKTAPFVIAVTALLLSVEMPVGAQTNSCTPAKCDVVITMSAGCGSGIKVAPDPIVVAKGATVDINWVISPELPWKFDDANGIVIFQPDDAFKTVTKGGKNFKINHKNKKPGAFKYDVNLVGPDGKPCKLDPTIVDQ